MQDQDNNPLRYDHIHVMHWQPTQQHLSQASTNPPQPQQQQHPQPQTQPSNAIDQQQQGNQQSILPMGHHHIQPMHTEELSFIPLSNNNMENPELHTDDQLHYPPQVQDNQIETPRQSAI